MGVLIMVLHHIASFELLQQSQSTQLGMEEG